jgi:homogentisate 1,2-dioxygenase
MATKAKDTAATPAMKQHLDSGNRDAMIVKNVEIGAPLAHSGNCPFWTADLNTAPVGDEDDPSGEPTVVCNFDHSRLKVSRRTVPMPYTSRHIDVDELHFVHRGSARFLTECGEIEAPTGRFVFIARGIGYRVVSQSDDFMSVIFESDQHMRLEDDVNKAEIPIIYPTLPISADATPTGTGWVEHFRTRTWSLEVTRETDPLITMEIANDQRPVFALDVGTIPAHQPSAPLGVLPFITFRGPSYHLEIAMPKTAMPFFHRNVRANETVFAHFGNGDRESLLGNVSTPVGSISNYPKGIDHRVGERGGESICLIWETLGDVTLAPNITAGEAASR